MMDPPFDGKATLDGFFSCFLSNFVTASLGFFSNRIHKRHGTDDRIAEEVKFAMVIAGLTFPNSKCIGMIMAKLKVCDHIELSGVSEQLRLDESQQLVFGGLPNLRKSPDVAGW
jgi:hypothetical protein